MGILPLQALRQHRPQLRRPGWLLALLLPLLSSCSPKTTTPQSRLWQGFVTRYNTLYHAQEAYDEGYRSLLTTTKDDYTRPLPLDPLAYTLEEGQERANFSRTLEKTRKAIAQHSMTRKPAKRPGWRRDPKAVALQARSEYNPALRDAWLLTTQGLFYSGKLEEARLTAEGIIQRYATEPEVREEARLWAVRSLTLLGRPTEAEELLRLFPLDPSTEHLRQRYLYPATRAELALAQGRLEEALPDLRLATQRAKEKRQRARLHYLLGQTLLRLDRRAEAGSAFQRASSLADDPKLELSARLQALRLGGDSPQAQALLRRLGGSRRYQAEQDQIFLALGQSLLLSRQSAEATLALQRAIDSARQHSPAWGEAHLLLGEQALASDRYPEAFSHFSQASTALTPHHPRHGRLDSLLPGLTLLAPVAGEVRRGDSLLRLARLPERERLSYIDSLILAVRRRCHTSTAPQQAPSSASPFALQPNAPTTGFYFDDPKRIEAGRQRFLQLWGDRPLTDDWNRSRRSFASLATEALADSLPSPSSPSTSPEGGASDSLSRAFYLRDLPLAHEAQALMAEATAQALLRQSGLLSERLELPEHAQRSYARLLRDYPDFTARETGLQRALLLALRRGDRALADSLRLSFLRDYPTSTFARLIQPQDYPQRLREQARQPERLYAEAWEAYQAGQLALASRRLDSLHRLPLLPADLTPRAELLRLLTEARSGEEARLIEGLRKLRERSPEADVAPYVASLLEGLEQGRRLVGLPLQRDKHAPAEATPTEAPSDSLAFAPREAGQVPELLLLYPKQTAQRHEVYFALMTFSFTHFTQWSLEALPVEGFTAWGAFRIQGFRSEGDCATFLARAEGADGLLPSLPKGALLLPLAPANLPLLRDETLPAYRQYLATQPRP